MFIANHFAFLSPALHLPHCVSFGVKIAPLCRNRKMKYDGTGSARLIPRLWLDPGVSLFLRCSFCVFVLALARPCLPLTKAYRGQYFFRYYHYVFHSWFSFTFYVVWLRSLFLSLSLSLLYYLFLLRLVTNSISI